MAKQYDDTLLNDILPDSISDIIDIKNAANIIDPELLSVSLCIREALLLSRIDELPEYVIDLMAWQYHVDMYEPLNLPIDTKRSLVRNAILLHRHKGTPWSITQSLVNMGFDYTKINEWWNLGTDPHTFSVELEMREGMIRQAERYIEEYKPVRSHLIELTCRLGIPEEVDPEELLNARSLTLIHEQFPWLGAYYNGLHRYAAPDDPSALLYGDVSECEEFYNQIKNDFHETLWAQYKYNGDLTYDGSVRYGTAAIEHEVLYLGHQIAMYDTAAETEGFNHTLLIFI